MSAYHEDTKKFWHIDVDDSGTENAKSGGTELGEIRGLSLPWICPWECKSPICRATEFLNFR